MISRKAMAIFSLAVICGALTSLMQPLAFDSYFSKIPITSLIPGDTIQSQDAEFTQGIYHKYTERYVVPIFIKESDKDVVFNNLGISSATRYTALSRSDVLHIQNGKSWKAFATTTAQSGRQGACIIQYKDTVPYPEGGQWLRLSDKRPSEVALIRGSAYHEVEHCMMPRWMLNYAVEHLIEVNGVPNVENLSVFKNTYALTLSEIFADVYALSNIPKYDTAAKEAIIQYRRIMHENALDKGVYAYNWRIIEHLENSIDVGRLPKDVNLRILSLLRLCLERLPLPTPQEIKSRYNL